MTSDPATVPQPQHPVHALTTFELRGYRHDLEHALATRPGGAAGRELLRARLAEVLGEQESRARIASGRA